MAYQIVKEFPNDILFEQEGPFVSIYLPTIRFIPENKKDPIVYKNLLKTVETSLAKKHSPKDVGAIMEPLKQMEDDDDIWNNTLSGMAVLCTPTKCVVYRLYDSVEPLAIVSNQFHTKPLMKAFQSLGHYQLLGLSGSEFDLFQGNRNVIEKIQLEPGAPRDIKAVLGEQLPDDTTLTHVSGAEQGGVFHGYGGGKPEIDKDMEKFFRYVDRFVMDNYSKPSGLPLILAALPEHHPTFIRISNNPFLLKNGIMGDYTSFTLEQLKESIRKILEPFDRAKLESYRQRFEQAKASGTGSDSLAVVGKAIVENRVGMLFINADKIIPGKVSPETGKVFERSLDDPETGDVLDELAQLALKSKSEVVVLSSDTMPRETGIAAIFRF